MRNNDNYDLYQAIFSLFMKNHGDVVHNFKDEEDLQNALEEWSTLNDDGKDRMDELVKYSSAVINFLSTV